MHSGAEFPELKHLQARSSVTSYGKLKPHDHEFIFALLETCACFIYKANSKPSVSTSRLILYMIQSHFFPLSKYLKRYNL